MAWDWTFVGELVIGIGVGGFLFAWFLGHAIETAGLRIASHPSVRKLASAADKFGGGAGSMSWPGVVGGLVNWLSGGRAFAGMHGGGGPGNRKALIIDTKGNVLGETDVAYEEAAR